MKLAYQHLEVEKQQIEGIKNYFIEQIQDLFPEVAFNGMCQDPQNSTYTLVNVALPIPKEKALLLDFHLDLNGIACSKGSACQSGSSSGSHVLNSIRSSEQADWPSLRFSFSVFNTKEEVDRLIQVLKDF